MPAFLMQLVRFQIGDHAGWGSCVGWRQKKQKKKMRTQKRFILSILIIFSLILDQSVEMI